MLNLLFIVYYHSGLSKWKIYDVSQVKIKPSFYDFNENVPK